MLNVYCDTGAYRSELADLQRIGAICLFQFKYENKNRRIQHRASPSAPTWGETKYSWTELADLSWNDMGKQSEHWPAILSLLGKDNLIDAKHLDSAYKTGCSLFLTSDKGDIASKKLALKILLGITVFHFQEDWDEFCSLLSVGGLL